MFQGCICCQSFWGCQRCGTLNTAGNSSMTCKDRRFVGGKLPKQHICKQRCGWDNHGPVLCFETELGLGMWSSAAIFTICLLSPSKHFWGMTWTYQYTPRMKKKTIISRVSSNSKIHLNKWMDSCRDPTTPAVSPCLSLRCIRALALSH